MDKKIRCSFLKEIYCYRQALALVSKYFKINIDYKFIKVIYTKTDFDWWKPLCPEEELSNLENSAKIVLLFSIIAECESRSEKLLVFSQSLFSLDVIEHFLAKIDKNTKKPKPNAKLGGFTGIWKSGLDYFRLEGKTDIATRCSNCEEFNKSENPRARLKETYIYL